MKAKGIRIIANLILIVGTVACLAGCITTLIIANGVYGQPIVAMLIGLGILFAAVVLLSIILHSAATVKAKRDRIRACWAVADAVKDEDLEALDKELMSEEVPPEKCDTPAVCYVQDTQKQAVKAPFTGEQLAKAGKVAKIAVPVAAVTLTAVIVGIKIHSVCKRNANEKNTDSNRKKGKNKNKSDN